MNFTPFGRKVQEKSGVGFGRHERFSVVDVINLVLFDGRFCAICMCVFYFSAGQYIKIVSGSYVPFEVYL